MMILRETMYKSCVLGMIMIITEKRIVDNNHLIEI